MVTLILADHGSSIGSKGDSFWVSSGYSTKPISFVPVTKVESILIDCKLSISSGALTLIAKHGIPVVWNSMSNTGMVLMPYSAHGTADVRRSQYNAMINTKGHKFAIAVIAGSILNRAWMLSYLLRYKNCETASARDEIKEIAGLIEDVNSPITSTDRSKLMSIEARAAKSYYNRLSRVIPEEYEFKKRTRRPATDVFSCLLNYGSAVLQGKVSLYTLTAGLDMFAGFLHVDRPGRESYVLDIMEEFRQPIVDYSALSLVLSKECSIDDFTFEEDGRVTLSPAVKKKYLELMHSRFKETYRSKTFEQWILHQIRKSGSYFRGLSTKYTPFIMKVRK